MSKFLYLAFIFGILLEIGIWKLEISKNVFPKNSRLFGFFFFGILVIAKFFLRVQFIDGQSADFFFARDIKIRSERRIHSPFASGEPDGKETAAFLGIKIVE